MSLELAIDLPEPWLSFRTEPAGRAAELDRWAGTGDDVLMRAFVDRFLDQAADQHIAALGVLPLVVEDVLEAIASVTITVLETTVPVDVLSEVTSPGTGSSRTASTRAGTASRQQWVATEDELVRADGLAPVFLHVRYLLPVLERGLLVAVDCATPSIAYADEFEAIFDGLVGTLELREAVVS